MRALRDWKIRKNPNYKTIGPWLKAAMWEFERRSFGTKSKIAKKKLKSHRLAFQRDKPSVGLEYSLLNFLVEEAMAREKAGEV